VAYVTGTGKGKCRNSQWTAARETSKKALQLDEEVMEVTACKPQFFAINVACKFWPYLSKAARVLPAL